MVIEILQIIANTAVKFIICLTIYECVHQVSSAIQRRFDYDIDCRLDKLEKKAKKRSKK